RSRTTRSKSACAPGSRRRPACGSATSSSSTRLATAAATRCRATPAPTWFRSAISRSSACPRTSPRSSRLVPGSSHGTGPFPRRRALLAEPILPLLADWARRSTGPEPRRALGRRERLRLCFGIEGSPWDEEKTLDRYELLYEAGLVEEARRDGRPAALTRGTL